MTPQTLSLVHLVQEPGQRTSGKPPLLLMLHGVGSNEQDLFGLAGEIDPRFFVISARAPLSLGPGAFGWYRVVFGPQGPQHSPAEAEAGRAAASAFIREAVSAYGLDSERVYLLGFSQGAITSLSIALTEPEIIAGAVIMSGRLLPEVRTHFAPLEQLSGLPVLVVHGTQDTVLPVEFGREINEVLAELPVALTYQEYPMAHTVSLDSLHDISAWLTARLESSSKVVL